MDGLDGLDEAAVAREILGEIFPFVIHCAQNHLSQNQRQCDPRSGRLESLEVNGDMVKHVFCCAVLQRASFKKQGFFFERGRLFTGQIVHHESCQAQANLH